MNREPLDLRRSLQILRRRLVTVGIAAALGAVAGAAYTVLSPPMHAGTALVVLPSTASNAGGQVLIAESNPVLEGALPGIKPAISLLALNNDTQVTAVTTNLLSITAQAGTATQAEEMANALADSYVAYADSPQAPNGQAPAKVMQYATNATDTRLLVRLLTTAFLGALLGALIGAVVALATGRNDRRLRERDLMADAIGVPVLASISVRHPTGTARWSRLLDDYEPSAADAFRLRSALNELGLAEIMSADAAVPVLPLSCPLVFLRRAGAGPRPATRGLHLLPGYPDGAGHRSPAGHQNGGGAAGRDLAVIETIGPIAGHLHR